MIKEFNENYDETQFEKPEPSPKRRRPWPVLKFPEAQRGETDSSSTMGDEDVGHEYCGIHRRPRSRGLDVTSKITHGRAIVPENAAIVASSSVTIETSRIDEDAGPSKLGEEPKQVSPISHESALRVGDCSEKAQGAMESAVDVILAAEGQYDDKLVSVREGPGATSRGTPMIPAFLHKRDDEPLDTIIVDSLPEVSEIGGTFSDLLESSSPKTELLLPGSTGAPVALDEDQADLGAHFEPREAEEGTLAIAACDKVDERQRKNDRTQLSCEGDIPGENKSEKEATPENEWKDDSEERTDCSSANRDDEDVNETEDDLAHDPNVCDSSCIKVGVAEVRGVLYLTHGLEKEPPFNKNIIPQLPKLEEFIPEEYFPDVLVVHQVDKVSIKYARVFPKFARDANEETEELERLAHLWLLDSKLGIGHHSRVQRAPLTLPAPLSAYGDHGQVTVAAKTAFNNVSARKFLSNEAKIYDSFPQHLQEEWCGYNLVTPLQHPVPVGAVVPKFYGYYAPIREDGNPDDQTWEHCSKDNEFDVPGLSPILLMEECGRPIKPSEFSLDDRSECYSLVLRLHMERFLQGSMYVRNILRQPGPFKVGETAQRTLEEDTKLSYH